MQAAAPRTDSWPGVVLSGSGITYSVSVYKNGVAGDPETVSCKQLMLHASDVIPAGTWVIVTETNYDASLDPSGGTILNEYTMQVPVWL